MTRLGDLYGNRFTILLRMTKQCDLNDIEVNFKNLRDNGFINYFGEQRFGTKNNF